jgi:hypothetical protein
MKTRISPFPKKQLFSFTAGTSASDSGDFREAIGNGDIDFYKLIVNGSVSNF